LLTIPFFIFFFLPFFFLLNLLFFSAKNKRTEINSYLSPKMSMKEATQSRDGKITDADNVDFSTTAAKPALVKPTDVLIKVMSLSVNPVDAKKADGSFPNKAPFPRGFGSDLAGVIEEVGASVTRFKVGDEVYADLLGQSVFAEYIVTSERAPALKPKNLSFAEAAAVPLASVTALQVLRDHAEMKEGAKVCIFGGSGGVGIAAIQIAKILGASHITTTSSNVDFCKSLGADEVINYKETDVKEAMKGKDYDVVFDCVGGIEYWRCAQAGMKKGAKFVTITGDKASMNTVIAKFLARAFKYKIGLGKHYKLVLKKPSAQDLGILAEYIESDKMKVVLDGDELGFSAEGVQEMFTRIQGGRSKGKIIMKVA
jgi:alcohol dehydrogenase